MNVIESYFETNSLRMGETAPKGAKLLENIHSRSIFREDSRMGFRTTKLNLLHQESVRKPLLRQIGVKSLMLPTSPRKRYSRSIIHKDSKIGHRIIKIQEFA